MPRNEPQIRYYLASDREFLNPLDRRINSVYYLTTLPQITALRATQPDNTPAAFRGPGGFLYLEELDARAQCLPHNLIKLKNEENSTADRRSLFAGDCDQTWGKGIYG